MRKATTDRERNLNMVFTTAIEGGINYWASVLTYQWSAPDPEGFEGHSEAADFYADIREYETDPDIDPTMVHKIDAEVIARGIREAHKYMREHVYVGNTYQRQAIRDLHRSKWDDVDYDATTADIVVQFGLFGELVYG